MRARLDLKTSIPCLILLCLAALMVAACASSPTPVPLADKPVAPSPTALPTAEGRTATPHPTVATATVVASPTIPKPTATFVPLITPSATATGDQLSPASVRRIGLAEAKALADAGEAILVDVRTPSSYEEAHIAGALSLPLDEVTDRLDELVERAGDLGGEALIIFYCA